MREPYDPAFDPPAPVLPILVARPHEGPAVAVRALLDSGADVTIVPTGMPEQLGLPVIGQVAVRVAEGPAETRPLHAARVRLGRREVHVEVIALGTEALIGRDLLRRFVVTLDGPAGEVRVR